MRRLVAGLAVLMCTMAVSSACGEDTAAPVTAQAKRIEITFQGDTVTPSGDRVDVAVGQPIELVVTADKAGEIHMHSDPEQEKEYAVGTTTVMLDPVERPGVVEVESHTLEQTIVQLEVR